MACMDRLAFAAITVITAGGASEVTVAAEGMGPSPAQPAAATVHGWGSSYESTGNGIMWALHFGPMVVFGDQCSPHQYCAPVPLTALQLTEPQLQTGQEGPLTDVSGWGSINGAQGLCNYEDLDFHGRLRILAGIDHDRSAVTFELTGGSVDGFDGSYRIALCPTPGDGS